MRIIHGAGYTDDDRKGFRIMIFQNIHKCIRTLCEQMDNLQIEYEEADNAVCLILLSYNLLIYGKCSTFGWNLNIKKYLAYS